MALPFSRNRTYAAGVPVSSQDLNEIQDAIVGNQHGEIEVNYTARVAGHDSGSGDWAAPGTIESYVATTTQHDLTDVYLVYCDGIPSGSVVSECSARIRDAAGQTMNCRLMEIDDENVVTHVTGSDSAGDGTRQTITATGGNLTIGPQSRVAVRIHCTGSSTGTAERRIFGVSVKYTRP